MSLEECKLKLAEETDPYVLRQLAALQMVLHFLLKGGWGGKLEMDVHRGKVKELRPRIDV